MRTTALRTLVALALGLSIPATALADPKDDARRHFVSGLQAAQAGDFQAALQHFLAAQEAYPNPATLYNIARAYQDVDDLQNALTYYRLFRDADPSKASDVEPIISVLQARLQQTSPTIAPSTSTPAAPTVISGVSPEVVARIQALSEEFQALAGVIADSAKNQPVATVAPPPTSPTTTAPTTTTAPATTAPLPDLPGGGFLTDAYKRVVVTASRYGQEPIDSPSAVTILTEQDIRLSAATSVPDLLRRVVGIDAMGVTGDDTEISIRGFNRELNNKILVLIDGRSTYIDAIGTTLWQTIPVSLDEIERIEIVRGPGSAVYGANAVTGVINIITRTPGEGSSEVKVSGGTSGYADGDLLASGRIKSTSYRFAAGATEVGRWAKEADPGNNGLTFFFKDQNHAEQNVHAEGRLDRTFGASGFASLSGGYSDGNYEIQNLGVLGDYGIGMKSSFLRGDVAYGPVHLRSFWNSNRGSVGPWAQAANTSAHSLNSPLATDVVDIELEGNQDFTTGPVKHRLNGGIGWRYKTTELDYLAYQNGGDHVTENTQEAFAQDEATIGKLKITASLRLDKTPNLPLSQTLSPRAAAIVRVAKNTSVRATGGTAFRAPNQLESYLDFVLPSSTADGVYVRDKGNIALKPERILTGEVGLHDESTQYHTADVSLFINRLQDIIDLAAVTPEAPQPYNADNQGFEAGTTGWINTGAVYLGYGVEAETHVFPTDGLDVYANADIQRIQQTEDGQTTADKSTSAVKVNAGVQYRTPWRTDLAADASYVGPQTWALREFTATGAIAVNPYDVPARLLLSAHVGAHPFKDDSLEVAVNLWNIGALFHTTNDKSLLGTFIEHPKSQPIGSRVYGTLTYRF